MMSPITFGTPRFLKAVLSTVVFLAVLACLAHGQKKDDLAIKLTINKVVVNKDGSESLLDGSEVKPGDVIQYTATYANSSTNKLGNLAPMLPIPPGTNYIPDSAKPAPTHASLDGNNFEPVPLKRKITLADGKVEEQIVPPSEYRALRWDAGDLKAKSSISVSARALVEFLKK